MPFLGVIIFQLTADSQDFILARAFITRVVFPRLRNGRQSDGGGLRVTPNKAADPQTGMYHQYHALSRRWREMCSRIEHRRTILARPSRENLCPMDKIAVLILGSFNTLCYLKKSRAKN